MIAEIETTLLLDGELVDLAGEITSVEQRQRQGFTSCTITIDGYLKRTGRTELPKKVTLKENTNRSLQRCGN